MTNLVNALFRIDPTDGLVEYAKHVKPYHSKILDVLVEYVYSEDVTVTVTSNHHIEATLLREVEPVSYINGYGYIWDHSTLNLLDVNRSYVIEQAYGSNQIDVDVAQGSTLVSSKVSLDAGDELTIINSTPVINGTGYVPGTKLVVLSGAPNVTLAYVGSVVPVVFDQTTSLTVHVLNKPTHELRLASSPFSSHRCLPTNLLSNALSYVSQLPITSINPVNRQVTVSGDITSSPHNLAAGNVIYINANTTVQTNGRYVISHITYSSTLNVSVITTVEPIVLTATQTGVVCYHVGQGSIPFFPEGCAVRIQGSTLPNGLSSSVVYYYVPTSTLGTFHLSTVRSPQQFTDYVDVSSFGSGGLFISRAEPLSPGEFVKVDNSVNSTINGTYTVSSVYLNAGKFFVRTVEPIIRPTPIGNTHDGVIRVIPGAFDSPVYTAVRSASDIHTDAVVREDITFEIQMSASDIVGAVTSSDDTQGWGDGSYDNVYGVAYDPVLVGIDDGTIPTTVSAHSIIPSSFDTVVFDVGSYADTQSTMPDSTDYN